MLQVRPIPQETSHREFKQFLELPYRLYKDDPAWVPPLKPEIRKHLSKAHPFFENAEAQLFGAWRGDRMVGRVTAHIDRAHNALYSEKTGFFGFYECEDDLEASRMLLDAARSWLRSRGMETMRGPFSWSINHLAGCLVEGYEHPPFIDMAHNPPYHVKHYEAYGLGKVKDLFAWDYDATGEPPEMALNLLREVEAQEGLKIRTVDMKNFEGDLGVVLDIFNEAWSRNWGFVPLSKGEMKKLVDDMKLVIEPKIAFIAEHNGEPAAIAVSVPNINQILLRARGLPTPLVYARLIWDLKVRKKINEARLIILGVRRKFRGSILGGLSIALYVKTHLDATKIGFNRAELGWTLEDNDKINNGIMMMGGKKYKTYRVYEGSVDR